jgi:hypothetical protein
VVGVQAIVSIKHPVAVNQDIKKLMVAVPEASLLRMMLFRLSEYGYPDFADVATGSNVGVAILAVSADDVQKNNWIPVGFARISEGGKIWDLLEDRHLAHLKHGEWVMFARRYADLVRLESPDAVIGYLEKPQAEDLRIWGRVTPELLAGIRQSVGPKLKANLANLPPERGKAIAAYLGILYSMAPQVHSVELSLSFTDDAIQLAYSAQFLPDSPFGRYLRYKPGPQPAVARLVSANAFLTMEVRQDPSALNEMMGTVLDPLIQVDYPPVSSRLRDLKAAYQGYAAAADGGSASAIELVFPASYGGKAPQTESFTVISGRFTREGARRYFNAFQGLVGKAVKSVLAGFKMSAQSGSAVNFDVNPVFVENAVTVDGIPFDSFTLAGDLNGKEISKVAQYYGVVGGNLVVADGEAALKSRLPALIAGLPLADGIGPPLAGNDQVLAAVSGGKLVALMVAAAKLDPADAELNAEVSNLQAEYAAAGPARWAFAASQAKGTATLTIPYKFVEASVHYGQWLALHRQALSALAPPPPQPPPAQLPPPDDDQPMPVPLSQ